MSPARSKSTGDSPPGKRRGRPAKDVADAASRILVAALRVFAREGFNGASLQVIADEAGVAKPLIHYHHASKDALWQAAIGSAFAAQQRELENFREQMATATGDDALRTVARQLVRFAGAHPELTRIVVDETSKGGARADWLTREYLLPGYRLGHMLIAGWREGLHTQAVPAGKSAAAAKATATRDAAPADTPATNAPPGPEHVIPAIVGVMNFPALEAAVIRQAFGIDVTNAAYRDTQEEVLYRVLRALL